MREREGGRKREREKGREREEREKAVTCGRIRPFLGFVSNIRCNDKYQ